MARLAWIGLGNMGRGMCKNIVQKGQLSEPLIVYNRTQKRADDLSAALGSGTKVASTIEDAVKSADIIFTCVGDDKAIKATFDTALTVKVEGKLFVDCSTVHPDTTAELSSSVTKEGAHFVAMPVFGAPAMADAGQLICVAAGPKQDIEKIRSYCKGVMGRAMIEFADEAPGKASLLKLLGNSMVLNMVESIAQSLTAAEKTNLGVDKMHSFIELMFPGPFTAYSNRMISGDYHKREQPLFHVDLALKDANAMLDVATSAGAKLRNVEVARDHLSVVKAEKADRGDIAGIYGAVRKESGLDFDNN